MMASPWCLTWAAERDVGDVSDLAARERVLRCVAPTSSSPARWETDMAEVGSQYTRTRLRFSPKSRHDEDTDDRRGIMESAPQ